MADILITGTTLVEKESRSIGDIPIGGIIEWDNTFASIPEGFNLCDGSTITDPLSSYNGSAVPNLNTNFYSVPGTKFTSGRADTDVITRSHTDGAIQAGASDMETVLSIEIPHGAIITGVVVEGNAGAEAGITWTMFHGARDGGAATTMATAAVGTTDTSITDATIDNENRIYFIGTGINEFDAGDEINGALITYTPRFKFIIRVR